MPEYGGPGETLWSVNLTKGRLPPTDVSMFSLDRQHKCLMTFILRVIYILEMDNPTKKEGKKVIQIPRDFLPSARAITHAVWCKSEEASELLAAVLGTDVLVFSAITGSMINHISSPCGKALHPSPILDWGGMPCVLAVGGCNNQKQGSIQLYSLSSKSKELDLTPKTIHTKETPTYMTLHSTKTLIAVYHSTVIQVWSTRTLDKTAERDFLSPVRSIAWGVTRQSNLLVLFHRDGDQRINAPVLAEVDLYNHTYVEEPGVHGQHPLAGVPAAKIHTLPLPFAPKLLVVAYSSHRCEGLYLRSEAENNSQVANGLYQVQTPLSPSQGIRAVGIRRVDSEKDRTLHLITLYKSGLLVARSFLVKTIDLLLDKQIRLLQERRDVEVMKIKSAGTSLESIKLRTTVPANQVAFLEQTHHNCKYPPVVFFEVLVKQGDQMPEVSVNGNCIRNDHELSLDDNLLEKISSAMQSAVLKAVRTGCGAWLPCMIDACYSQLKSFGNLQPSQLKGLRTKSNPISFDKRPGHGLRNTFTPGSTFTASAGDTKFSAGSYSHSGSVTTQTNQVTGGTPPNSFGERSGEYLQLTQSPQLCYRRAFVIQPRVCSGVFSPDGSLIVYNIPQNSLYSNVELLQGFTEPPEITNWKLDGTREAVLHNIQHSTDAEASLSWKLLLPMLSCPQSRSVALSSVVGSILSSLASNKRHFLAAAIACCCISASRSQVPLSFTPLATCSPPVVSPQLSPSEVGRIFPVTAVEQVSEVDNDLDTCLIPRHLRGQTYSNISMLLNTVACGGQVFQEKDVLKCLYDLFALMKLPVLSNACEFGYYVGETHNQDGEIRERDVVDTFTVVLCAICDKAVRGLASGCVYCGHVSHNTCHDHWFKDEKQTTCPLGCDCKCYFSWNDAVDIETVPVIGDKPTDIPTSSIGKSR